MARASNPRRLAAYEPFYDLDPQTSATIEVFYAHRVLAESFGAHAGWFWWVWQRGCLPDRPPTGPFHNSYAAYRDAMENAAAGRNVTVAQSATSTSRAIEPVSAVIKQLRGKSFSEPGGAPSFLRLLTRRLPGHICA